ncbi:MAG TPA: GxxExxY protein [Allosphingosinicella sp.]
MFGGLRAFPSGFAALREISGDAERVRTLCGLTQRRERAKEPVRVDIEALATIAVDCGFKVHDGLGPGLLESVYEAVLAEAFVRRGLAVERQKPIPIRYADMLFDEGFRADLLVPVLGQGQILPVKTFVPIWFMRPPRPQRRRVGDFRQSVVRGRRARRGRSAAHEAKCLKERGSAVVARFVLCLPHIGGMVRRRRKERRTWRARAIFSSATTPSSVSARGWARTRACRRPCSEWGSP